MRSSVSSLSSSFGERLRSATPGIGRRLENGRFYRRCAVVTCSAGSSYSSSLSPESFEFIDCDRLQGAFGQCHRRVRPEAVIPPIGHAKQNLSFFVHGDLAHWNSGIIYLQEPLLHAREKWLSIWIRSGYEKQYGPDELLPPVGRAKVSRHRSAAVALHLVPNSVIDLNWVELFGKRLRRRSGDASACSSKAIFRGLSFSGLLDDSHKAQLVVMAPPTPQGGARGGRIRPLPTQQCCERAGPWMRTKAGRRTGSGR